jgi:hypothetical protein
MRVLLDECIPRRIRNELPGHVVTTVAIMGWAGLKNGALIKEMEAAGIEALITMDKGLQYQQNLGHAAFGTVLLRAISNRFDDLQPLMPQVLSVLPALQPGQLIVVS